MASPLLELSPEAKDYVNKFKSESGLIQLRDMCLSGDIGSVVAKAPDMTAINLNKNVAQVCGFAFEQIADRLGKVSSDSPVHPLAVFKKEATQHGMEPSDANAKNLMELYFVQSTGDKNKQLRLKKPGTQEINPEPFYLDCRKAYYATVMKQVINFADGSPIATTSQPPLFEEHQQKAGMCMLNSVGPEIGRWLAIGHGIGYLNVNNKTRKDYQR